MPIFNLRNFKATKLFIMNTFEKLTAPLKPFFSSQGSKIDKEAGSKSLFFEDFTLKMLSAVILEISSLRELISTLKSNPVTIALAFKTTPYSTFRDGFSRFQLQNFKTFFCTF